MYAFQLSLNLNGISQYRHESPYIFPKLKIFQLDAIKIAMNKGATVKCAETLRGWRPK